LVTGDGAALPAHLPEKEKEQFSNKINAHVSYKIIGIII